MLLHRGPNRAQRHQMLAADHHGKLAVLQYARGEFFDLRKGFLGIAEAKLQIAAVKYGNIR